MKSNLLLQCAALKIGNMIGTKMNKKQFEHYVGTPVKADMGNVEQTLVFMFRFSENMIQ